MPKGKFVNFGFKPGQIEKWGDKILKDNKKAIASTLNELSKVGIRETAQELQEETGVSQKSVKSRITVTKASKFKPFFSWFISGRRLSWISPRLIKKSGRGIGLSHLADNKVRKRVTGPQHGGSSAFLAKLNVVKSEKTGRVSKGNKIAVYRGKTKTKKSGLNKLVGHSLAWLLDRDWEERIKAGLVKLMPEEMRKQLKKLRFRK